MTDRKPTRAEEIVKRMCPNGHLSLVRRVGQQPYCPRCGMNPETLAKKAGRA